MCVFVYKETLLSNNKKFIILRKANIAQDNLEITGQILESFLKSNLYFFTFVLVKMAEQRAELITINIIPI